MSDSRFEQWLRIYKKTAILFPKDPFEPFCFAASVSFAAVGNGGLRLQRPRRRPPSRSGRLQARRRLRPRRLHIPQDRRAPSPLAVRQRLRSPLRSRPDSRRLRPLPPPFPRPLRRFYLVRTKDAIEAAKRAKDVGKLGSEEEVSRLDVSIGRVSILSLSADSSFLAVCVAGTVHFFPIASLLKKDREPSLLCSLPDSGLVKDMKWRNTIQTSFVVLSTSGKLYLGEKGVHLKDVMNHFDAVDWSLNGDYIVVAKNSTLRLLSSDLVELFSISLSFESVMDITYAKFCKSVKRILCFCQQLI